MRAQTRVASASVGWRGGTVIVTCRCGSAPDASALPRSGRKRTSRGRTERGLPGRCAVGTNLTVDPTKPGRLPSAVPVK